MTKKKKVSIQENKRQRGKVNKPALHYYLEICLANTMRSYYCEENFVISNWMEQQIERYASEKYVLCVGILSVQLRCLENWVHFSIFGVYISMFALGFQIDENIT